MADAVKVAKPKVTRKTYKVAGNNLREVYEDLKRKAPPGGEAGSCRTAVNTPSISHFDETEVQAVVEYTVTAKAGPTLTIDATITLPELTTRNKLSKAAQAEWDRFLAALSAHEDQHLAEAVKVAEDLADEMNKLKGSGKAKDKAAALAAAQKDFIDQYRKLAAGPDVGKKIQDAHNALDRKGNTFNLNVNIP